MDMEKLFDSYVLVFIACGVLAIAAAAFVIVLSIGP